ncbi:hypothetical protein ACFE04_025469 [Oxalis oulophora]
MAEKGGKERVCVTGAGGFVASWLVKLLLSKGYFVHGTVRDPCDAKNDHLKKLKNSSENLMLFKTDLLDYEGLCGAFAGCTGVFHVACPVPGWIKVSNPQEYYCLGKTIAEKEAFQFAKQSELDIVAVCPSIVIGPMLQSTLNASSKLILGILKGGYKSIQDADHASSDWEIQQQLQDSKPFPAMVDVRDVTDALVFVYEKPGVEGRYICTSYSITMRELTEKLNIMYPNYNFPNSFTDKKKTLHLSAEKLLNIGWNTCHLKTALLILSRVTSNVAFCTIYSLIVKLYHHLFFGFYFEYIALFEYMLFEPVDKIMSF